MTIQQPQYSKAEFARRGDEIYETKVRRALKEGDRGKIVAIDVNTGEWEIDKNEMVAASRLEERLPNAQIWIVRVGSRYVRRFGAGRIHNDNRKS